MSQSWILGTETQCGKIFFWTHCIIQVLKVNFDVGLNDICEGKVRSGHNEHANSFSIGKFCNMFRNLEAFRFFPEKSYSQIIHFLVSKQ